MTRYRKKPVEVEAFKYENDFSMLDAPKWFSDACEENKIYSKPHNFGEGCYIKTLEGEMFCRNGDYIIQGIQGEIYPCKPDIFEATYSVVVQGGFY